MAQVWLGRDECRDEGDLPPVCVVCGAHAEEYRSPSFAWHPKWTIILILVHVLVYAIVAAILTKRMRPSLPVCEQHQSYFLMRRIIITGGIFVGFMCLLCGCVVMVMFSAPGNDAGLWGLLAGTLGFIMMLIIVAVYSRMVIRPVEITDHEIHLAGVSEPFVEAMREQRRADREGREQRRVRRDDEDDRE